MTKIGGSINPPCEQNNLSVRGPAELMADGSLRRNRGAQEPRGGESAIEGRLWDARKTCRSEAIFGDDLRRCAGDMCRISSHKRLSHLRRETAAIGHSIIV